MRAALAVPRQPGAALAALPLGALLPGVPLLGALGAAPPPPQRAQQWAQPWAGSPAAAGACAARALGTWP